MQERRTKTCDGSIGNTGSSTSRSWRTARAADSHNAKSAWQKHRESVSSVWPQICGKGDEQFSKMNLALLCRPSTSLSTVRWTESSSGVLENRQFTASQSSDQNNNIMHTGLVVWTMRNDPSQVVLQQDCHSLPWQHVASSSKSAGN